MERIAAIEKIMMFIPEAAKRAVVTAGEKIQRCIVLLKLLAYNVQV